MHTSRFRRFRLAPLALLLLVAGALPVSAQPDATPDIPPLGRDSVWVNVRPYPLAVWGPRAGFGAGGALVVHNLGRPGSQLLVTAAPAHHDQSGTFSWSTARRPEHVRRFLVVDGRARHTDRSWFYGIGPRSSQDSRTSLELFTAFARVRYGHRFFDDRLLVQPQIRVEHARYQGVDARRGFSSGGDLSVLPPFDPRVHLAALSGETSQLDPDLTGVAAGVDVAFDTRDRVVHPTRGVLLRTSFDRYVEATGADLTVDQIGAGAAGWIPLGGVHRIALHAGATFTRQRSGEVVPYHQLPVLDGRTVPGYDRSRFTGNDRFVAGALYQFPLFHQENLVTLEGHVGAHAASVYTNLFDEFEAAISFNESLGSASDLSSRVPLRPAVSAGLRAGPLFRDAAFLDLAVGWSPEGVSGVRFTFIQPLTPIRAPHHR